MLFLNEKDIQTAVSMTDMVDAVDTAYRLYEENQFTMPERMHVDSGNNTLLLMPCLTSDAIGTKLVTVFPENTKLPVIQGMVILNSAETGEIKALMDGAAVTALRTGAIGGSAVRHLAKPAASTLAIIGTGVQGLYQAAAACAIRPITDIYLYNRSPEKLPGFIKRLNRWLDDTVQIHRSGSAAEAMREAEIVVTATTSAQPVLPYERELFKNKLIIGVGSYKESMQEFPQALYEMTERIFVDSDDAVNESGDLLHPLKKGWIRPDRIQRMSSYITAETKPELGDTVVFKSTGMALFDVAAANVIYQKAKDKGAGTWLS